MGKAPLLQGELYRRVCTGRYRAHLAAPTASLVGGCGYGQERQVGRRIYKVEPVAKSSTGQDTVHTVSHSTDKAFFSRAGCDVVRCIGCVLDGECSPAWCPGCPHTSTPRQTPWRCARRYDASKGRQECPSHVANNWDVLAATLDEKIRCLLCPLLPPPIPQSPEPWRTRRRMHRTTPRCRLRMRCVYPLTSAHPKYLAVWPS